MRIAVVRSRASSTMSSGVKMPSTRPFGGRTKKLSMPEKFGMVSSSSDLDARDVAHELVPRIDEELDGVLRVVEVRDRVADGDARARRDVERRTAVGRGFAGRALAFFGATEREADLLRHLIDLRLAVVVGRREVAFHAEHFRRQHFGVVVVRAAAREREAEEKWR